MEQSHDAAAEPQPHWAQLLPRQVFQEIILVLRSSMPPPVTDQPADASRRDQAAMAAVASLLPETAAEGRLAAQFVAADAWAMDCLRLAAACGREIETARRYKAQAMSLMREGKSALRLLLRLQDRRQASAKDAAAAERAEWVEHVVVETMAAALQRAEAPTGEAADRTAIPELDRVATGKAALPHQAAGGRKFEIVSSGEKQDFKTRAETMARS